MKSSYALAPLMLALPLWAQYSGPAILSRGEAPAAMANPQISFRPYVEVSALYDTGLAGVAVNAQGQPLNEASTGESVTWGISGTRGWRHTRLGLEYHGAFSHYTRTGGYDYVDQSLLLGINHEISRHVSLSLREAAGIINLNYGPLGLRQTVPFDPSTTAVPSTDYFADRTIYSTSGVDLVYNKTARLSFDLGGDAYLIRRHSHALYGTTGLTARGDTQYRATRRTTIGAQYSYMHFAYPGIIGGTDAHSAAATYSIRINRTVEFSGYAGVMRVESKFIQTVPVDPVIAALLGITSTSQITHNIFYTPNAAARLSKTFRRGVAYISGGRTVYPGNGLFLTSKLTSAMAGYTYTGLRRWSLGVSSAHSQGSSVGLITGSYNDTSFTTLMSRQIKGGLNVVANYILRRYQSPDFQNYSRTFSEARVAIGFSPGNIPLRVW